MGRVLKLVDTPTLSNAIESLRSRSDGFTACHIRSLFPEFGRMVGYVVTAEVETMTEAPTDRSKTFFLYEAVLAAPKPAVVAYQEIHPRPEYAAHCGEVMATIFKRLQAPGLVSDCAVRDMAEVRAMRFHYFSGKSYRPLPHGSRIDNCK
jgi:4-hydroxy-4-methyl-2-oxoglutarate aldolase